MRNPSTYGSTSLRVNQSYEGEPLELKIAKMTSQNEPIESTSPMYYTDRKDGVMAETDIRTDRWEIAREAMDRVHKTEIAKRTESRKEEKPNDKPETGVSEKSTTE